MLGAGIGRGLDPSDRLDTVDAEDVVNALRRSVEFGLSGALQLLELPHWESFHAHPDLAETLRELRAR